MNRFRKRSRQVKVTRDPRTISIGSAVSIAEHT